MAYRIIPLFLLGLLIFYPLRIDANDVLVAKNILVITNSENPPFASGVIQTWVEVTVKWEDGTIDKFYDVFLSDKEKLQVGEKYNIWFHIDDLNSYVGPNIQNLQGVKVIDKSEVVTNTYTPST